MALTVDWPNRVVESDASIPDLLAFKSALRDREDDADGILYPPIITFKQVDIGSGGFLYAVDFINGYALKFVGAGPFTITGNLNCPIVPTGVQVERKTSAAFATTSTGGGGGGLTVQQEQMLTELHKLAALKIGDSLVVDENAGTRSAGSIVQTISTVGGVTTITRA